MQEKSDIITQNHTLTRKYGISKNTSPLECHSFACENDLSIDGKNDEKQQLLNIDIHLKEKKSENENVSLSDTPTLHSLFDDSEKHVSLLVKLSYL